MDLWFNWPQGWGQEPPGTTQMMDFITIVRRLMVAAYSYGVCRPGLTIHAQLELWWMMTWQIST